MEESKPSGAAKGGSDTFQQPGGAGLIQGDGRHMERLGQVQAGSRDRTCRGLVSCNYVLRLHQSPSFFRPTCSSFSEVSHVT